MCGLHPGCRVGGAGRAAAAGRQSARTRWLRSIPWRQRQVLGFLSVVDGGLQFDDDGVGGIGLAAGWHGDRRHGEDGIRREKELLLALHIRLLHQVHMLAAVPARATSQPATCARVRQLA